MTEAAELEVSPSRRSPVHAVTVGPAVLLRGARDAAEPLTRMTARLPTEDGRALVVTAPSVSVRPDYTDLVTRLLDVWPADRDAGLRLVALGLRRDPAAAEAMLRELAAGTGREIVGPLGTVTVGVDGTLAVSAPPGAPGGWVTCTPGQPSRYHAAWFPLPDWGTGMPAETAAVSDAGASVVHPVPAGFWILPYGTRPGSAGAAACLPPDDTPAVFLGGYGRPPLPVGDVKRALRGLPHSGDTRLVLLPGALPDRSSYAKLRRTRGHGPITAAVPVWSPERQWELATVAPSGRVVWRPPHRQDPDEPLPTLRRLRQGGAILGTLPRPVRIGARTAAGWSFLDDATPMGVVPAVAGYVVEIETDEAGFRLGGHPVPPAILANRIVDLEDLGRTPLVVVGHGTPPADADATYGELSRLLSRPVTAAAAEVAVSPTGILYTAGRFDTWQPAGHDPDGHPVTRRRELGGTLPPIPGTTPPEQTPAGSPPVESTPSEPLRAEPPSTGMPPADPSPTTRAAPDVDEERLRQMLGEAYDSHERAVEEALAEDPDVLNLWTPTTPDTTLVAVRAYAAAERDTVNRALREGHHESAILADAVAAGLRRLPAVFGPVFATTAADAVPPEYRTGLEYVEPGFVDVDLFPGTSDDARIRYVIWSATARRLGGLSAGAPETAVFPPRTRFRVLGVERAGGRLTVLLLDLTRPGAANPVDQLQAAADRLDTASRQASGLLGFPIGM